ncbi:MAG: Mur ligase family protein, partial [bacterium]
MLVRTRFILVTGSLGKTTAKELLGQILASRYSTFRSVRNQNAKRLLSLNILRVRPWHRFAVVEAGTGGPGELSRSSKLLLPDVAIVLVVAGTHLRSFGSLDEIADEKLSALEGLRKGGTAIINADDQRLCKVDSHKGYKVLKFGTSSSCDLWAEKIESKWPETLSFEARTATEKVGIRTQLPGTHWIPSLLASLLAAKHCGVSLAEAAETTPLVRPFTARMQPVQMPSGAIVIRDEYNGSPSSFHTALEFFETARARRKILIAGDYSDSVIRRRRRLNRLGRTAAELCDLAIFIGESSHHSKHGAAKAGMDASKVFTFSYPRDAVS